MANPTPKPTSTRVQLPVGLSGAEPTVVPVGSLAFASDTDQVRVQTSTGWEDVGGGGGGGSITSVVEGPGIDITGGTGPVVTVSVDPSEISLVGDANGPLNANTVNAIHETSGPTKLTIGNINDFQLLQRVGATVVGTAYPPTTLVGDVNGPMVSNQVNAIHETSGPTQLTIGSIGEGQAVARVGGALVGVNAGDSNPWTAQPSAATYADEFISDTSSSYSFYNRTNSVAMVRVGNVDPYGGGSLGNGQYNSTCYGSWLVVQFPPGKDCLMYKALTTVNSLVTARFQTRAYQSAAAVNNPYAGLFCAASSGGLPDIASNSSEVGVATRSGTTSNITTFQVVGGTTTDDSAAAGAYSNSHMDCFAQRFVGTTRTSWAYSTVNGATNNQPPARTFSPTVGFVGFRFLTGATPNSVDQTFQVDFLRIQPNTAWIYSGPAGVVTIPSGSALSADITTYTAKTTPVAADQIYIADSAASNAIKRSTVGAVVASGASSPYTIRTSTASAYDDEFVNGSTDLATRGWTVYSVTDNVTMTRLGDVDPWNASLTNSQYNSTLQGTYLLLQFPRNKRCLMYRAFTGATAGHVFIRAEVTAGIALGNDFAAARVWLNNAGRPDTGAGTTLSTFAMIQNAGNVQSERWGRGDTTDVVVNSSDNLTSRDGRGFYMSATNQYRYFATGVGGVHQAIPQTAAATGPTISSLAWIGIDFVTADVVNTTNLSSMYIVDYIRYYSGTGWIL